MPLPKPQSLIISCQSIAPFVDVPLLRKLPDGALELVPTAPAVPIDKVLKRLAKLDDEYDLHPIPGVLDVLKRNCWDAGYSLGLSPAELLDDSQITTIDDLATVFEPGGKNSLTRYRKTQHITLNPLQHYAYCTHDHQPERGRRRIGQQTRPAPVLHQRQSRPGLAQQLD